MCVQSLIHYAFSPRVASTRFFSLSPDRLIQRPARAPACLTCASGANHVRYNVNNHVLPDVQSCACACFPKAGIAAKAQGFEEKDRIEAEQKGAAALAKWDEVKTALADLTAELRVDRVADVGDGGPVDPDPTIWQCETLKILRLRLAKGRLVSLPPDLGKLINLTELIVAHNSLTTFPAEIGLLLNLRCVCLCMSVCESVYVCVLYSVSFFVWCILAAVSVFNPLTRLHSLTLATHHPHCPVCAFTLLEHSGHWRPRPTVSKHSLTRLASARSSKSST
jgi:hypothetical protein